MNGDNLQNYLLGGIPSGWTSGFISGYMAVGSPEVTSGITTIRAVPLNTSPDSRNLTIICHDKPNGAEITVWDSPSSTLVSHDTKQICSWLFRR